MGSSASKPKVILVGSRYGKSTLLFTMVLGEWLTGAMLHTVGSHEETVKGMEVVEIGEVAWSQEFGAREKYKGASCVVYVVPCPPVQEDGFWESSDEPVDLNDTSFAYLHFLKHFAALVAMPELEGVPLLVCGTHADVAGVDPAAAKAYIERRLNLRALRVPWHIHTLDARDPAQCAEFADVMADMCEKFGKHAGGIHVDALLPKECRHGRVFHTIAIFLGDTRLEVYMEPADTASRRAVGLFELRHRVAAAVLENVAAVRASGDDDAFLATVQGGGRTPLSHIDIVRVIWVLLTRLGRKEALRDVNLWSTLRAAAWSGAEPLPKAVTNPMRGMPHVSMTYFWVQQVELCMRAPPACSSFADLVSAHHLLSNAGAVFQYYSAALLESPESAAGFVPPDLGRLRPFVEGGR